MKNGYKTIEYLEENWTEKELRTLAESIEEKLALISQNPNLFQASDNKKKYSSCSNPNIQYALLQV